MLVGYSSSSEEENEAATAQNKSCSRQCREEDDGEGDCPARKKAKTEEHVPKTRYVESCVVAFCRRSIIA